MAALISPDCMYLHATSRDTRLAEQAVSIVMLGPFLIVNQILLATSGGTKTYLDIQKVADAITEDCWDKANCSIWGSVLRVSCMDISVIWVGVENVSGKPVNFKDSSINTPFVDEPTKQPTGAPFKA